MEKTAGRMGETVALDDYRSYAPGMALGRQFSSGPSEKHEPWKVNASWTDYLRLIAEVVRVLHGFPADPFGTSQSKWWEDVFNKH